MDKSLPSTASPYHRGTSDKASDKALYKMEGDLEESKPAHKDRQLVNLKVKRASVRSWRKATLISTLLYAQRLLHTRVCNLYGVGTRDSTGFSWLMETTNKSKTYKNVIDWLNGRCRAFTDHTRPCVESAVDRAAGLSIQVPCQWSLAPKSMG